jgi:hypothetical protein
MRTVEYQGDADGILVENPGYSELSFVEALAHPGEVFEDPMQVVDHPWFSEQEKRTILLSWGRDEFVKEQIAARDFPELRRASRTEAVIRALSRFDPLAAGEYLSALKSIRDREPDLPGFGEVN